MSCVCSGWPPCVYNVHSRCLLVRGGRYKKKYGNDLACLQLTTLCKSVADNYTPVFSCREFSIFLKLLLLTTWQIYNYEYSLSARGNGFFKMKVILTRCQIYVVKLSANPELITWLFFVYLSFFRYQKKLKSNHYCSNPRLKLIWTRFMLSLI